MKKVILLVAVSVLLCMTNFAVAQQQKELGVTLDLTYVSKWLSKGVEAYDSKGGLFATVDLDFYGSGLGLQVTHRNSTSSGFVDNQRFDYRPYFKGKLFEGETYVTNYNISVGYEHYYKVSRRDSNTTWEWIFAFSWPKLFTNGIVPFYIAHYEYPASGTNRTGDYNNDNVTGWVHRFGLGYDMAVAALPNPLNLSAEIAYYDGLGKKVHDWGYTTFGLSTKFNISENLAFVPGVYYQITLDESISPHKDITYAQMSLKYKF